MTSTRPPAWDVPAIHIEQPISVPTSAEVKASFDPKDVCASGITLLTTVASSETEIKILRHDFPDSESAVSAELKVHSEGIEVSIYGDDIPMRAWQRLTELANAASVASQQLLAMITAGTWR
jgi:hypothetical protein